MTVLVTGANGFIGKNLVLNLKRNHEVIGLDLQNDDNDLQLFIEKADFIVHLAGSNRPILDS